MSRKERTDNMNDGQTISEQLEAVGKQILAAARNELYMKMRFLDVALSSFSFIMDEGIEIGRAHV